MRKILSNNVFGRASKTARFLKSYCRDENGNFAMMFALGATVLLAGAGVAIDYSQLTSDHRKAQNIADAAVLAAASNYYNNGYSVSASKEVSDASLNHHFSSSRGGSDYKISTDHTRVTGPDAHIKFETTIEGTTKHAFMGLFGNSETDWTIKSYAQVSEPKVEILLVVDVSASMAGTKITSLKQSLAKFSDQLSIYENKVAHLSVSMIPFAENINFGIGAASWLDSVSDINTQNAFEGCFIYRDDDDPGLMLAYDGGRKNGYPLCPSSNSETILFSTNPSVLKNDISAFDLGWGTDTGRAIMWGQRFLDNDWREAAAEFSNERPLTLTDDIQKIVIILTDGAVAVTDANQDGRTDSYRTIRRRKDKEVDNFRRECRGFANIANTHVYTVGYQLTDNKTLNALKACVTGNGQHFDSDVASIDEVFDQVLSDLEAVRITH